MDDNRNSRMWRFCGDNNGGDCGGATELRPEDENKPQKNQQRFIPWEDDHIPLVGNGTTLYDYLDFIG